MQKYYTLKGKHLTIDNRRLIEKWKIEGKSNREIADLLGKAPQTINNEINRGTTLQQCEKGYIKRSIQPSTHRLFTKRIENVR